VSKKFPSDPFLVELDELHPDGYGIGNYDGRKIAVTGTLAGELVKCQVYAKRKKRVFARPVEIIRSSVDRVPAQCEFSDYCGGCSLHHLDSTMQLAFKQQNLLEIFAELQPEELLTPLRGPTSGYRRKARLGVKFVEKKGKVLVGFREKAGKYLADIDTCMVLHESIGPHLGELAELIGAMDCYNTVPQIEVAVGDAGPALVFRHLQPLSNADVMRLQTFQSTQDVEIYLQPGGLHTVQRLISSLEKDRLHYRIPTFGIEMAFHPLDFIQVNLDINLKLIDLAVSLLDPVPGDSILDLFCGIGNFSLPLAIKCKHVTGVEGAEESVARARENAALNAIDNVTFYKADLISESANPEWQRQQFNKVLLDPPRSGAWELVRCLVKSDVNRIVYVSCNPVTLARDAACLVENGFKLSKAGVVDMFPHTNHVESIALFER
jgi:23S rRNA (uracil1939-C5)-methyltransferase